MKPFFVFLAVICTLVPVMAADAGQVGAVRGKVFDQSNGEPLIGASVQMDGTDLVAFTDMEGQYVFRRVPAGNHAIMAQMDGFNKVTVDDVTVAHGEVTVIDVSLDAGGLQQSLVVTADLLEESDISLLRDRRKSNSISDAIGGETIRRSGGSNAADAIAKVTGASVVGGKYIYIRGLGDRYTSTHLNGIEMPTADPDVKSFQADLFPTSMLDRIVTLKSFTPDKPGNFSGGIVDIGTKSFPDQFTMNLSYSVGYNENTTFNDEYLTYSGGGNWLGNSSGGLPQTLDAENPEIPNMFSARNSPELAERLDLISKSFDPVMSSTTGSGPVNQSFSVAFGNSKSLFGRDFGFNATLSYSRNYSYYDNMQSARWKLTEGSQQAATLINQSEFSGQEGQDKVNWGGLMTLSYEPGSNHKVNLNFIYTKGGESTSRYNVGRWPEQFSSDNAYLESRLLKYTERNLTSFQLHGQHYFAEMGGLSMEWTLARSSNSQDEPDTRIFTSNFSDRIVNGEPMRVYSIAASIYNFPARYFRDLQEDGDTAQVDFTLPISQWSGLGGKVKFGYLSDKKDRDFHELRFEYASESNTRYAGDPESFFGLDNVGILGYDELRQRYIFGNVIQLAPDSRGGDYQGSMDISAAYASVELPINEKLRVIGGVRLEQAEMIVTNGETRGDLDDNDWLPSLNAVYEMNSEMNLRFSYGRTLARPNMREKAPYASYDFLADGIYQGNPDLKRTLIDNFDLRWEWYPRSGELVAASLFRKDFQNPIERAYNIRQASEFGEKTFLNVPTAVVQGIELEIRRRFDQWLLEEGSPHVFSISANLSLIDSTVDIPPEELAFIRSRNPDAASSRTLQGQSPYLVNLGLNYDNYHSDTFVSLFYNVFGERLDEVGYGGAPDALEQPRDMLDFTLSQRLVKGIELKLTAKNLMDSPIEIIQEFKGTKYPRSEYKTGRSFSLALSYKP